MLTFLKKISTEQFLFIAISLIGIILFSYKITSAPLTADELSAVNRGNYNTLSEVFKYSISTDSHPPFSQILLFYWIKLVGFNVLLIKLPFLLMGIASIFLIYQLAKQWFGKSSALLSIAFFVSIQFTIMYSQIARPYVVGLFLTLIFAIQWTKIIEDKAKIGNYILYVIIGVMSAYNHHIQTLQIAVIGLVGLFFITKKQLLKYILVNLCIGILYLPNLSIMLNQLEIEGLDYLEKPDLEYILDYFNFIFQYSIPAILLICSIIGFSIYKSKKIIFNKYSTIAFLLFILPLIIGYVFSVTVRPVIPYRALIFLFPFFVLFLFSFSNQLKNKTLVIACSLILIINIYTLFFNRNYYQNFNKGISKTAITNTNSLLKEIQNPYIIFNMHEFNINFYYHQFQSNFKYENLHPQPPSPAEFRKKISTLTNQELIVCNIPHQLLSVAQEYYPTIKMVDYSFNFNYYLLSKDSSIKSTPPIFDTTLTFNHPENLLYKNNVELDSATQNYSYHFNQDEEWGPNITIPLGEITQNSYTIIEAKVTLLNPSISNAGLLAFDINNDSKDPIWRSAELKNWINKDETTTIYFTVQLNELVKHKKLSKKATLTIYYWNQSKQPINIDNLSIKITKGNHLVYSLLEDFPN